MLSEARYHLFTYGTLRPGGRYHTEFCRGIPSTPAFVRGRLYHLKPGYPALAPGNNWVRGDILFFDDASLLKRIDGLEDFDPARSAEANLYLREPIDAYDADKLPIGSVETYRMPWPRIQEMDGFLIAEEDWFRWTEHHSLSPSTNRGD